MPKKSTTNPNFTYVNIPKGLIKLIDDIVDKDHYPTGNYRSRADFVIQAVKKKLLEQEKQENK
jgi:metal-responsive CopG/Arc/MetJ family transcriptional regulator